MVRKCSWLLVVVASFVCRCLIDLILLDTCHLLSSFVIFCHLVSCSVLPCQERHQATLHDPQEHRDMKTRYDKIILLNRGEHGMELEQLLSTNLVYEWTFATSNNVSMILVLAEAKFERNLTWSWTSTAMFIISKNSLSCLD